MVAAHINNDQQSERWKSPTRCVAVEGGPGWANQSYRQRFPRGGWCTASEGRGCEGSVGRGKISSANVVCSSFFSSSIRAPIVVISPPPSLPDMAFSLGASQEQTHDPPEARVRIVSRLVHPLLLGDLVWGVDETAWTGRLALHVALLVVCIVRPGVRGKSPGSDGLAAPIARSGVAGRGCGARGSWLTPS